MLRDDCINLYSTSRPTGDVSEIGVLFYHIEKVLDDLYPYKQAAC